MRRKWPRWLTPKFSSTPSFVSFRELKTPALLMRISILERRVLSLLEHCLTLSRLARSSSSTETSPPVSFAIDSAKGLLSSLFLKIIYVFSILRTIKELSCSFKIKKTNKRPAEHDYLGSSSAQFSGCLKTNPRVGASRLTEQNCVSFTNRANIYGLYFSYKNDIM